MYRHLTAALLVLSLVACRSERPTASPDATTRSIVGSGVDAQRIANGVRVTNGTSSTIRFHVFNPGWLGLLRSCDDDSAGCLLLSPSTSRDVSEAQIYGLAPGANSLVVRYWTTGQTDPIEVHVKN